MVNRRDVASSCVAGGERAWDMTEVANAFPPAKILEACFLAWADSSDFSSYCSQSTGPLQLIGECHCRT